MKKITIYIISGIFLLLSSGCEPDFIDQASPDRLTSDNFFRNESDANSAVFDAYTKVTYYGWQFGEYYVSPLVYRGDDTELLNGAASWSYLADIGNFNYNANSSVPRVFWTRLYRGLNAANFAINGISKMGTDKINEVSKNNLLGEAFFIRGLAHFYLLINFEQIILVDNYTTKVTELERPLSTREKAWELIESDFAKAASLLPESWNSDNLGRATKGAAFGFLGKAHLYQKEYAEAHNAFSQMPKVYDLIDNYESIFTGNENSKESVFEIQFVAGVQGPFEFRACIAITYANEELGGWNMFRPSDKLISTFKAEPAVGGGYDKRLLGSLVWNDPKSTFLGKPLQTSVPSFKKYISNTASLNDDGGGENFYLMRYADVLLMDAEALNETNNPVAAIPFLNKVRNRAGLSNFTNTAQAQVREEIRKQRFLELACEGNRFYDLVRWGIATETLHNSGRAGGSNYIENMHAYFKVPQREVDNNSLID